MMEKNEMRTVTLEALVAVTKTETGMDYVQVMPDTPSVGLVAPFHGMGYGQMLSNGSFDFIRKPRKRRKPVLKLPHSSVTYGADGYDRFVYVLPSEQRGEFGHLLRDEAAMAGLWVDNDNLNRS
jgi:hypothetical protein